MYQDFLTNDGKIIHKWVHYFPIYERYLSKFKNQSVVVWEIGVSKGGSAQMLKRYLGPFAQIVGIDIDPECAQHSDHGIDIHIGDQPDTEFLQSLIDHYGQPDIVIDDGSHIMEHVNKTFSFLYEQLKNNGVYIVEDMHTAYWPSYGGGLRKPSTFIEHCKSLVDSLNGVWAGVPSRFTDMTFSISFYDSVVVFEKMQWQKDTRKDLMRPEPAHGERKSAI